MRLLTLNTHSLIGSDYEQKLARFCRGVADMCPDVIALQEVNQSKTAPVCMPYHIGVGEDFPIRCDNYILGVMKALKACGTDYNFVWRGMKESYGQYEEGLGILARDKISEVDFVPLTPPRNDWKMRYALGVRVNDMWFYSAHTGRWDDNDVPFDGQIECLCRAVGNKRALIMGDFNCPDKSRGYELLKATGWQDIWQTAHIRCGCATARADIDGWDDGEKLMRIDYMFSTVPVDVSECRVVFTNRDYGAVSDHYGVFAECNAL